MSRAKICVFSRWRCRSLGREARWPAPPPGRRRRAPPRPPPAAPPPAADATKVKVEKGAGGKKVYRITEEIRIEGKIQKPEAFFFYQKSTINYDWQELKQDFIPKIVDSVSRSPFSRSSVEHVSAFITQGSERMATQAAAPKGQIRLVSEAEDPPYRHHPGRADRRGAAGPQARKHHDRPVGEEHVRRPRRTPCRATGCCSRRAAASTSPTSPTAWTRRIAVGNEIISLAQLKQTGKIQKRGRQLGAAARRTVAREDHARRT